MKVVHLVGGKLDLVLQNPALRAVPFEEACSYAAENLDDLPGGSPSSPSSSLYGQDDLSCHEVSAKDDTGIPLPLFSRFLPRRRRRSLPRHSAQVSRTKRRNRRRKRRINLRPQTIQQCPPRRLAPLKGSKRLYLLKCTVSIDRQTSTSGSGVLSVLG
jgi:hypothetical protein